MDERRKERQWKSKTEKMDLRKRKNDSGNRRQGELTKERGGTTVEIKDRENGLKKEKERQRKQKTERIDERTWRNDSGNQRQRKWT